jgi:hypothetical protein
MSYKWKDIVSVLFSAATIRVHCFHCYFKTIAPKPVRPDSVLAIQPRTDNEIATTPHQFQLGAAKTFLLAFKNRGVFKSISHRLQADSAPNARSRRIYSRRRPRRFCERSSANLRRSF